MLQYLIRSAISGMAAWGSCQLMLNIGIFKFDDMAVQNMVIATLISASGGLLAALVPIDEKSWSWFGFVRLVLLGAIVGVPTYFALGDPRLAWVGKGAPWVECACGILAYPIIRWVQKTGPAKLLWSFVLRFKPQDTTSGD